MTASSIKTSIIITLIIAGFSLFIGAMFLPVISEARSNQARQDKIREAKAQAILNKAENIKQQHPDKVQIANPPDPQFSAQNKNPQTVKNSQKNVRASERKSIQAEITQWEEPQPFQPNQKNTLIQPITITPNEDQLIVRIVNQKVNPNNLYEMEAYYVFSTNLDKYRYIMEQGNSIVVSSLNNIEKKGCQWFRLYGWSVQETLDFILELDPDWPKP